MTLIFRLLNISPNIYTYFIVRKLISGEHMWKSIQCKTSLKFIRLIK